ncbi:MAG: hypothetical protein PHO15_09155 [Eubacteriales bacterium]|nr:hypothetical protein [Eubacteriales bacterium]
MKRLMSTFFSDMRYQWRYGFYLIYAVMTVFAIVALHLMPEGWRPTALVIMLLSDPSLLGFLFIGGILQLERGEGILDALFCAPLRPWEYITAKALSLGILSTLTGCVIALGSGVAGVRYALLVPAMLFGSACFTLIGISVSVNLKSTNAFLSANGLGELILLSPPLLLLFGVSFTPLEVLPGSIVLRLIQASFGLPVAFAWYFMAFALWTGAMFLLAHIRLVSALSRLGGGAS